jgi:hypothetical protein
MNNLKEKSKKEKRRGDINYDTPKGSKNQPKNQPKNLKEDRKQKRRTDLKRLNGKKKTLKKSKNQPKNLKADPKQKRSTDLKWLNGEKKTLKKHLKFLVGLMRKTNTNLMQQERFNTKPILLLKKKDFYKV